MHSKAKGARAEREVCNMLEHWWARVNPDVKFSRTPGSGAWGTTHGPEYQVSGDVVCTDPRFPFCVEVKHRETWNHGRFLGGQRTPALAWWAQAERQAYATGKRPMLVARKNREPWYIAINLPFATSQTYTVIAGRPVAVYTVDDFFTLEPGSFVEIT